LTDLKVYDQAEAALKHAATVNPQSPKPYLQLGFLYEAQSRWEDALEVYRKAADLAPDAPQPQASIGTVLMQLERPDEAVVAFERNVELAGGTSTPIVHWDLAFMYGQRGQLFLALQNYRKVRDLLAGRTEKEAVDLRKSADDNVATLEQRLRPYRFTFRATPWSYDTNIASRRSNQQGEVISQIGGTVMYWLVNEDRFKVRGTLAHNQIYYPLFLQMMNTSTSLSATVDYTVGPKIDVDGTYSWSYGHGTQGPLSIGQSINASITRRGQLPSGIRLGLSYSLGGGLGASTVRSANAGYSLSVSHALGDSGTIEAGFGTSLSDSNREDQVSQSRSVSFSYSRTLWKAISASLSYGISVTDYVNPFTQVDANTGESSLVSHNAVGKNYGLNFTHNFRKDLDLSVGAQVIQSESNFSVDRPEDLTDLLNDLVKATGSYQKLIVSMQVSKSF
jgi:tetratricopeptide (TPR) repeat protein